VKLLSAVASYAKDSTLLSGPNSLGGLIVCVLEVRDKVAARLDSLGFI
jgi:hypothetical protein